MILRKIINKRVVAIRGFRYKIDKRVKNPVIYPEYILFDDGKTYVKLEDQDGYTYHDCSGRAKLINLIQDSRMWNIIMSDKGYYPDANIDIQ